MSGRDNETLRLGWLHSDAAQATTARATAAASRYTVYSLAMIQITPLNLTSDMSPSWLAFSCPRSIKDLHLQTPPRHKLDSRCLRGRTDRESAPLGVSRPPKQCTFFSPRDGYRLKPGKERPRPITAVCQGRSHTQQITPAGPASPAFGPPSRQHRLCQDARVNFLASWRLSAPFLPQHAYSHIAKTTSRRTCPQSEPTRRMT